MVESADILVVDDEPYIVALLVELLIDAGYCVRTASNGRTALAAVEKQLPALILLDYMMPVLSGMEVVRVLRAQGYAQLPIIIMTAVSVAEPFRRAGATDFLPKPFVLVDVLACVEQAIGAGSSIGSVTDDEVQTRVVGG
jgi:CheY-like chemotaxis protein